MCVNLPAPKKAGNRLFDDFVITWIVWQHAVPPVMAGILAWRPLVFTDVVYIVYGPHNLGD